MQYCYVDSPIGKLLLAGKNQNLELLGFSQGSLQYTPEPDWHYNEQAFQAWKLQLCEYFAKKRQSFDLPYKIQGTAFQQQVLQAVAKVPYGKTTSYADIAEKIQNPKAVRAVGMANSRNKLPIIIPCHRIINKNGALCGFGGGIEIKRFLLNLENPCDI